MHIFGSNTIFAHLVKGMVGIGAIVAASLVSGSYPAVWLVAVPIALIAFRGCPMCWTVGLAETVIATVSRGSKSSGATCAIHHKGNGKGDGPIGRRGA